MSRFEVHGSLYSLAYGIDHMPDIGMFLQVWDTAEYSMPDGDNILVDDHRVSVEDIVAAAQQYDVPLDLSDLARNVAPDDPDVKLLDDFGLIT